MYLFCFSVDHIHLSTTAARNGSVLFWNCFQRAFYSQTLVNETSGGLILFLASFHFCVCCCHCILYNISSLLWVNIMQDSAEMANKLCCEWLAFLQLYVSWIFFCVHKQSTTYFLSHFIICYVKAKIRYVFISALIHKSNQPFF